MSIFSDKAIVGYSDDISALLTDYTLYNRTAFHKWFFGVTEEDVYESVQYDTDMDELTRIGSSCASHDIYSANAMKSAFGVRTDEDDYYDWTKKDYYDILFAIDKQIANDIGTKKKTLNDKLRAIVGTIIVEEGNCAARPNSWSVKLICVKPNRVKGSILMGACLYCIKSDPHINQECLLELADGYNNLPAFYSYTALGFLRDDSLRGKRCLYAKYCMPMRADLSGVSQDSITNKLLGIAPMLVLSRDADPSGLWNRKCYVIKYKNNAVLKEIQIISNLMLGLTLLKNAYMPGVPAERALYMRYNPSGDANPNSILSQLSMELNAKLERFDRLTAVGQSPCDLNAESDGVISAHRKCHGTGCNILGGRSRKKSRGKKSRGKKSRRKYYNPK